MAAISFGAILILGSISRFKCDKNDITSNVIKPESLELVKVIKQDLRRNNDDYADAIQQKGEPSASSAKPPDLTPSLVPAPVTRDNHNKSYDKKLLKLEKLRRRAYGPVSDVETRPASKPKSILNKIPRRAHQLSDQDHRRAAVPLYNPLGKSFKFPHLQKQFPKKYRVNEQRGKARGNKDKLQLFIEKNRGTLQQYAKMKREKATRQRARLDTSQDTPDYDAALQPSAADQLDMAPAQGGRIHVMRLKGRLCHRNVMIPEGPKYDSKGKVYLPAHNPARTYGRQFHETKPPPYVLPRCCNCCKKSLLGCE